MKRLGAILIVFFSGVLLACQLEYILPTPEPSTAPRATRTKTPGSPGRTAVPTSPPSQSPIAPIAPSGTALVFGTAKENLRMRAAPSASAQQIGSLNKGDTIQIIGRTAASDWLQVFLPNSTTDQAWIAAAFVDVKGSMGTVPVVDASSAPAPQPLPQPYPAQPPVPLPRKSYP